MADFRLPAPHEPFVTMPTGVPTLTLGYEAIGWATKYLRHPNGPRANQRWEFIRSQVMFLLWWYAVDDNGRWIYRKAVRRLAKGSGKSPFAALVALVELCAPVRLADFDPKLPGGCKGKPVAMPLVQIAATAEAQTENTMRMVRAFAPKGSRVVRECGLEPGKLQYNKTPEGVLKIITTSSSSAEGAEASLVIGDETEHWKPSNGGPDFAATLEDNLTKSGNRMFETCNAWVPGTESVAEASWDAWVAEMEGRTRGEGRTLYDARVAPADTDLRDEQSLMRALAVVYDDCWWQDLAPIVQRIWHPNAKEDDSRRKYLNQPTAAEDAWTTPQLWGTLSHPEIVVADGEDIVLFFDGSKSRDATALVACRMSDGHIFPLGIWEPDPSHDDEDQVPVAEIDLCVKKAHDKYHVVAFFADVQEWESFVKVSWPALWADQYVLESVPGGKEPQSIAWDMRSHKYEFAQAAELCEAEIVGGLFTHDGDAVLARHVGNARRRVVGNYISVSKESRDSPHKIDGAVCVIGARMVRRLALAAKPKKKPHDGRVVFA